MKKLFLLAFACVCTVQVSLAQTRRIMHRSHSGLNRSWERDNQGDNFGINDAIMTRRRLEHDSVNVKRQSDSVSRVEKAKAAPAKPKATPQGKQRKK